MISMRFRGNTPVRRGLVVAGGLVAASLVLTSCSGSSGGSSAGTDTAGLKGSPIKVALVANISGPSGEAEAGAAKVFEAWGAATNAAGGIAGHPVTIVVKDTKGDAPTAQTMAEELVADTSIAAVVSDSSATEGVVGQTLSDAGLPVVGGEGYSPLVWGKLKNWFGITTTFPQVVNMQVASAQPVGGHTLSVVACAEDPSCVAAMPLFEGAAKAAGDTFAGTVKVAGAAPNYTAECLSLVKKNADFVQLSVAPQVGVRIVSDCQTQGYKGYFGSSAASVTSSLYSAPGIRLAGGLNAFPWWVDDAPVKHFREVMTAQKVAEKDWAQPTATALWATGELLTKTMAKAAPAADTAVTRETVLGAYTKISGETLDGLLPQPITFTADQPAPPVNCYWLFDYQNGAFKGTFAPTCPK